MVAGGSTSGRTSAVVSGRGRVVVFNTEEETKHPNKASPGVCSATAQLDPPCKQAERSAGGLALCLFTLLRQCVYVCCSATVVGCKCTHKQPFVCFKQIIKSRTLAAFFKKKNPVNLTMTLCHIHA